MTLSSIENIFVVILTTIGVVHSFLTALANIPGIPTKIANFAKAASTDIDALQNQLSPTPAPVPVLATDKQSTTNSQSPYLGSRIQAAKPFLPEDTLESPKDQK